MADIVTSRQFTDGERGITAQKLNDIVGSSTIQPAFYSSKPTAPSADPADIALILKAGAYAQVPISALAGSATQAQIWDTRLRSYNAIGNPNFECNQRSHGVSVAPGASGLFPVDRWAINKSGMSTGAVSCIQNPYGSGIQIPGTSYSISGASLLLTLTAQQASLAAGDIIWFSQMVESIMLRELISDAHSVSVLARSSVANLKFGVAIRDGAATHSLTKLCSLGAANTWTLIQLPNLPIWPSEVSWPIGNGSVGYQFLITLVAGSSYISPANDTWQTGGFIGAVGQSNFAANPVNSTFEIAFVQHEPGTICTTLMDKPFAGANGNLDECLRYYQKSYDYATAVATGSSAPGFAPFSITSQLPNWAYGGASFAKPMAKVPTFSIWSLNGVAGAATAVAGGDLTVTGTGGSSKRITQIGFGANRPANELWQAHYTADTGW